MWRFFQVNIIQLIPDPVIDFLLIEHGAWTKYFKLTLITFFVFISF